MRKITKYFDHAPHLLMIILILDREIYLLFQKHATMCILIDLYLFISLYTVGFRITVIPNIPKLHPFSHIYGLTFDPG